jgi:hypothetical protein
MQDRDRPFRRSTPAVGTIGVAEKLHRRPRNRTETPAANCLDRGPPANVCLQRHTDNGTAVLTQGRKGAKDGMAYQATPTLFAWVPPAVLCGFAALPATFRCLFAGGDSCGTRLQWRRSFCAIAREKVLPEQTRLVAIGGWKLLEAGTLPLHRLVVRLTGL